MAENIETKAMSSRPKKVGTVVSAYIEQGTYDKLTKHCELSGQSKTKAIERAIEMYCTAELEKMQRKNE